MIKNFLFVMIFTAVAFGQGYTDYQWLNPSPIGTSMGVVKVWDANTVYAFGSAGTFVKTTDGGQTFTLNPYAGAPNPSPYITTNDIYGASFIDMNTFYVGGLGGVTKTTDGGETFSLVGGSIFSTSTIRKVVFLDENTGFVAGAGPVKLSKTTDGGNTWTINSALPSTFYYALQVFDTSRIVIGGFTNSGANVRLTTDGGVTWTGSAAGTGIIQSMAFLDTLTGFAGGTSGNAFKTTDGGLTWNQLTNVGAGSSTSFYNMFVNGSTAYFVGSDSSLYVTSDSGATFTALQYLQNGQATQIVRAGGVDGSNIYVVGDNGYFFKSTDDGVNWNSNSKVYGSGFVQGLWGDETGKIISVGTSGPTQVLVSDNYGTDWTPVSLSVSNADLRSIFMFDQNTGYAVGSGGRIWKTTDGGYNWDLTAPGTNQAFNDVDFYNEQYGMVAGNGGQVWKTTDGGTSWVNTPLGTTLGMLGVSMIDSLTALVVGSQYVYKTTDGGTTWTQITPGFPASPVSRVRMYDQTTGYVVGASGTSLNGYLFKTTDAGDTWTNMNFPFTSGMLYNIVFRNDSDYVITGYLGGVFHTTNDGQTWTQLNLGMLDGGNLTQVIGAAFVSTDTVIVGGAGASIVKVALQSIVPVELTGFTSTLNGNDVLLNWSTATESNNRGFEVQRANSNSGNWKTMGFIAGSGTTTEPRTYSFTDKNVSSGSYFYRLRQIDFDGSSEYTHQIEVQVTAPVHFNLAQNYPNPFNPTTSISFNLPDNSNVQLKIFDILGREVSVLLSGKMTAGEHIVNFNAKNMESGVYFYRLEADGDNGKHFTSTKKMMLIK